MADTITTTVTPEPYEAQTIKVDAAHVGMIEQMKTIIDFGQVPAELVSEGQNTFVLHAAIEMLYASCQQAALEALATADPDAFIAMLLEGGPEGLAEVAEDPQE